MPLPNNNNNKPEPISTGQPPDALDVLLQDIETHDGYFSAFGDTKLETGAASERILSHTALIELLHEPELQAAVAELQKMSECEAASFAEASPFREIGSQIGSYRLQKLIACGGMGQVYRAVHVELDKPVAIKLLPPDRADNAMAIDRFRQEMKALGQFRHPHVVLATDAGEADGHFYLVMEYVEGFNMSELVKRLGSLPIADAAEVIRQAALGVQAIHRQGLIHRDIKPSNIMLSLDGTVKVLDLGLSKFNAEHVDAEDLTVAGHILGTKRYMAPEQFETSRVDARADLYSLASSLESLLSCKGSCLQETKDSPEDKASLTDPQGVQFSPERDDVPPEFLDIIRRFTARSPSDRPDSAGELIDALQPFCVGSDLQSLLRQVTDANKETNTCEDLQVEQLPRPEKRDLQSAKLPVWAVLFFVLIATGTWLAIASGNSHSDKIRDTNPTTALASSPAKNSNAKESQSKQATPQKPILQRPIELLQERQIAVWVLMKGGQVVRHPHGDIHRVEDIPKTGPFRVRSISLVDRGLADVDLLPFQRLSMIDTLMLSKNSLLTNRGLIEVSRMKTLKWLYVGGTQITDDALPSLNNLTELESLGLGFTTISGDGLAELVQLRSLRELQLNMTHVTDDGLQYLKNFPNLLQLDLTSADVTNEGLRQLVESAGQLKYLQLKLTKVTDDGIPHLKKLQHLKELNLELTAISPEGVASLRKELPNCKIKF